MNDHDIEESLNRLHAPAPPAAWQQTLNDLKGRVAIPVLLFAIFCCNAVWEAAKGGFDGSLALVIALAVASLIPIVCFFVSERYYSTGRYNLAILIDVSAVLLFLLMLPFAIYFFLNQANPR